MPRIVVASMLASLICSGQSYADHLEADTYVTDGYSHYEDGTIYLEAWGDSYIMRASLVYGEHLFETKAFLEPVDEVTYRGSGTITVRYSDTAGCRHRFGVRVIFEEDKLFLRENTPVYIPYNPKGPCTAAGPYIWFNHEKPYVLQD